ncbi:biotin--[acetyl-CoA-carboxylase] ligase [Sphingomonas alpina]|uniref:biotin--[biotin carboxyl-carrier protein] ligase n=1 Tax=Sphingomonas alpina TaxID=653931 RepID=A0A7H0LPF2_9SPHN|nr:biotin--[acetyl-CoA-carboxylase] ligase [Sphingomonas alpina]QNQ11555.1 biotin--[acetyl-CoA-carboxylase] ligase [Sphingomonas alpina]
MLALARSGTEEGVWLRAERQTGGRGRQGRAWASPVGNLYASTLVRLRASDPQAATLALLTAVALEEVVRAYLPQCHSRESGNPASSSASAERQRDPRFRGDDGARSSLQLKWPNDLLLGGAKLSGILLEGAGDAVVIGIGVNLAHHPTELDRPATSLAAQGVAPDPADFLDTLAEAFALWLARWRGEGLAPIRARWLERAHAVGTALTARLPDGSATDGLFAGLDNDGALILRLADGTTRVIHAADVFLI